MRKKVIAAALLLTAAAMLTACGAGQTEAPAESIQVSDTVYKSGTYQGKGIGFSGPVLVTVTVEGGKLADITVDEHQDGRVGEKAYATLTRSMVAANSPSVDAVSGATMSSGGFKEAVRNALKDAE